MPHCMDFTKIEAVSGQQVSKWLQQDSNLQILFLNERWTI